MTAKTKTPKRPSLPQSTPPGKRAHDMKNLAHKEKLGLTEQCMAFGINTSALYQMQSKDAELKPPMAILLRLYETFPELLPRIQTPSFDEFWALIRKADPTFKETAIGPLLGMHKNWVFTARKNGFDGAKMHTRILVHLITTLLQADPPGNWPLIKDLVETEIRSNGLEPDTVWRKGRWQKPNDGAATSPADRTEEADTKTGNESQKLGRKLSWGNAPATAE